MVRMDNGSLTLNRDHLRPLPAPGTVVLPESGGYRLEAQAPRRAAAQRPARRTSASASRPRWPCSPATPCPPRPTPARRSSGCWCPVVGAAGLRPRPADHAGDGRGARHLDVQLPPDDQGLPVGRWRVHRHQGQPRAACPRRWPAWRCSPTTSSPWRCRCRPAWPRCTRRSRWLRPYRVPMALVFIAIIAWGNLRGVKESGRMFAVPTYGFLVSHLRDDRRGHRPGPPSAAASHHVPVADHGPSRRDRLRSGIFLLLHAFASGGAAMTGVEAISNGVPAFKKPGVEERPVHPDGDGHVPRRSCSSASRGWR